MVQNLPQSMSPTSCRVLLASQSPRRRQLLGMIVPSFEVVNIDADEVYPSSLSAVDVPSYLSRLKSEAYHCELKPDELLITADTVVIHNGEILGKPNDENEACRMLSSLASDEHIVVTGVTLATAGRREIFSETTYVRFGALSDRQIHDYVRTFAPLDKAGAYGIQEWIGAVAIEGIRGCFYNVMGLPLHALYRHIRDFV